MTPAEVLPWAALAAVLCVFFGMLALAWRALSIAHDLAKLALQGGVPPQQVPQVPSVTGLLPTPKAPTPAPVPAGPTPVIDEALVSAVKKFEGFSAKAYGDFKQYSIGYGTKASSPTDTITEADADKALRHELAAAEAEVEAFAPTAPKGVKQALTDLTYNAGTAWQKAGLGAKIKSGDYEGAKANLLQYNHAGGEVNAGLTARREAEVKWFDNPL